MEHYVKPGADYVTPVELPDMSALTQTSPKADTTKQKCQRLFSNLESETNYMVRTYRQLLLPNDP